MSKELHKGLIVSDFNADNLSALLTNAEKAPSLDVASAPFGQVFQILVDENAAHWTAEPDFVVVWTRPEGVAPSFAAARSFEPVRVEDVLEEVDAFADLLLRLGERVPYAFIPTWVMPAYDRGFGPLDMRNGTGLTNLVMRMNLHLAERLGAAPNLYVLNTGRWTEAAGRRAYNPKLWYMGKIAFSNDVFREAAQDIRAGVGAVMGAAKKLVVLDLDETLWGGVVGDDGWQNLTLGGHDPVGEAFVDFQEALKALTRRGIVLGIASKNEESVALEAIRNHPEMVLRLDDFAGWKINWSDKAQNILDLVQELNLGLQSVVFIDDNPVERARVREMLPEVFVPEWPVDRTQYKQALLGLTCFDSATFSTEDAERTKMYVTERNRTALRSQVGSIDEWLDGLNIEVKAEPLNETNLPRAAQLFNKTNQMNLATRRLTASELSDWASRDDRSIWTFRVADKFGDSGLTGILGVELDGERALITDFLLSCRVMGRKVEETMVAVAVDHARTLGAKEVVAVYHPTKKNRPCLAFWQRSEFEPTSEREFRWDARTEYPFPNQVSVTVNGAVANAPSAQA